MKEIAIRTFCNKYCIDAMMVSKRNVTGVSCNRCEINPLRFSNKKVSIKWID